MARNEAPVKTGLSFDAYLVFEKTSPVKHEFIDGQLFMMAGASERHNRLAFLLAMQLEMVTQEQPCQVYLLDLLVRTPNNLAYYPDVFVVCDPSDDETQVKRKPCLIIEILSDSTEVIDRGEKLSSYTQIDALQTYVLISQDEPKIEVYQREMQGWNYNDFRIGDTIYLPCVDHKLELESLYTKL
jgi:Uma2 family endonuclease